MGKAGENWARVWMCHWDGKNLLNEYDISTDGLADGTYTVTVFSNQISTQNAQFCMSGGNATIGACL
jgi:hypothetical protein